MGSGVIPILISVKRRPMVVLSYSIEHIIFLFVFESVTQLKFRLQEHKC